MLLFVYVYICLYVSFCHYNKIAACVSTVEDFTKCLDMQRRFKMQILLVVQVVLFWNMTKYAG